MPYRTNVIFCGGLSVSAGATRVVDVTTDAIRIVVSRLPHIANFTDFEPLDAETEVWVEYLELEASSWGYPDAVIIPGTKTTITDLQALHTSGMADQIIRYAQAGGTVMGICGGYQMLGHVLSGIPRGLEEFNSGMWLGLELLPTLPPPSTVTKNHPPTNKPWLISPQAGSIRERVSKFVRGKPGGLSAGEDYSRYAGSFTPIFEDGGIWVSLII